LLTLYKNVKLREQANQELTVANEALKEAKEKAEEASRLKSQFVSTITHELRTPLYGVIGITNIITDEHRELSNSPHLKSLKFSAKYLLSLVNDILQINKIEEKRVVLENLIFNLTDEITTIQNSVEYIAERNNDKLIVENTLSLMVGCILHKNELLNDFYSFKNPEQFVISGLLDCEHDRIREVFKSSFG
jgi:signal transduction histidine kinase